MNIEYTKRDRRPLLTGVMSTLASCAILMSGVMLHEQTQPHETHTVSTPLTYDSGITCEPVAQDSAVAVRSLLAMPEVKPNFGPFDSFGNSKIINVSNIKQIVAKRDDVGLIRSTPEVDSLKQDASGANVIPVRTYLTDTQEFLGGLGIYLVQNDPRDTTIDTQPEGIRQAYKTSIINLLNFLIGTPEEAVTFSNVHDIYTSATDNPSALAYAGTSTYNLKQDSITVGDVHANFGSSISVDDWGHEWAHNTDRELCGSSSRAWLDLDYIALNGPGTTYSEPSNSYDTYLLRRNELSIAIDSKTYASSAELDLAWKQMDQRLQPIAQSARTFSDYHTNVLEDKAELYKNIDSPYTVSDIENGHFPILQQKFELLFSRLYAKAPRLARYYADLLREYRTERIRFYGSVD